MGAKGSLKRSDNVTGIMACTQIGTIETDDNRKNANSMMIALYFLAAKFL